MNEAEWIVQLGRCGLIQVFYIPCEEVQQLRLLASIDGKAITEEPLLPKIHVIVEATAARLVEATDRKLSV